MKRVKDTDCVMGMGFKSEVVNTDGSVIEIGNGGSGVEGNSAGSSGDHIRTYRRRKGTKMSNISEEKMIEDGKGSGLFDFLQTINEPLDSLVRMDSQASRNGYDDCSVKGWRKMILEQIYQSLDGTQSTSKVAVGATSNGSTDEITTCRNTVMCNRALFDVLISPEFTDLCDLLSRNFRGMKVSSLLDFSLINSRIKEGAYESSPMLFHSDIQQVWTKLQNIGTEMVSLGKSLSEKSKASCRDEQFHMQESNKYAKVEQLDDSCQHRASTCKHCEKKAEGRDRLLCDYCEESYHILCIKPPVQGIPSKSWYCTSCREKGIGSRHENCVLCDQITEIPPDDLEERNCNICRDNIELEYKFRVCGHAFCSSKYYHERCLTIKQLNTYASCWYCPSCLCRGCLNDRDDDKIVLCDGCDQAFHIYCMNPPRAMIPEGKWFCTKCDEGIQQIRKVKMAYLNNKDKGAYENFKNGRKEVGEDLVGKSGRVNLLLNAAKTLN